MVDEQDDVAVGLDDNNIGSVDYSPDEVEPEDVNEQYVKDGDSVPPNNSDPWDPAFEETDFHIQNPEDVDTDVDTYSGHAGTAHVWRENQYEVVVVYEFDSTFSFAQYPSMNEAEAVDEDVELLGRQALSEGQGAIMMKRPATEQEVESLVGELAELDESLLEEGHAEYGTTVLTAMENGDTEIQSVNGTDTQFDAHQGLYRKKDRVEN